MHIKNGTFIYCTYLSVYKCDTVCAYMVYTITSDVSSCLILSLCVGLRSFASALVFELLLTNSPHSTMYNVRAQLQFCKDVCMCVQVCVPECLYYVLFHYCHWPSPLRYCMQYPHHCIVLHNAVRTNTCLYMQ